MVVTHGFLIPPEIVMDITEVEMGLETFGVEHQRPTVKRLCFDKIVVRVVQVSQVDDRGDEVGVKDRCIPRV